MCCAAPGQVPPRPQKGDTDGMGAGLRQAGGLCTRFRTRRTADGLHMLRMSPAQRNVYRHFLAKVMVPATRRGPVYCGKDPRVVLGVSTGQTSSLHRRRRIPFTDPLVACLKFFWDFVTTSGPSREALQGPLNGAPVWGVGRLHPATRSNIFRGILMLSPLGPLLASWRPRTLLQLVGSCERRDPLD